MLPARDGELEAISGKKYGFGVPLSCGRLHQGSSQQGGEKNDIRFFWETREIRRSAEPIFN